MEIKKGALVFIFSILFLGAIIPIANAATVQGSVFDIFLDELDKAVITIDTEPQQTSVSKGGAYSFELPPGTYTINAIFYGEDTTYEAEEEIKIKKEGNFRIDLILTPNLDSELLGDDNSEFEDLNTDFTLEEESSGISWGLIITLIAILLIILYFHLSKSHFIREIDESELKSENEEELEKVLKFIKSIGGRATQKDIRKKFPSSEAKISLMITELESKGLVKKIKKGRGNIIILTKEGTKK